MALCIGAGVVYGVAHDEITARISLEYFTVAHPVLIRPASPFWLGLIWGVVATVPVAALAGWLWGEIAVSPNQPPEPITSLAKSLGRLLVLMGAGAAAAGSVVWLLTRDRDVPLPEAWRDAIPPVHRAGFAIAWAVHIASYAIGCGGGALLLLRLWIRRGRPPVIRFLPRTSVGVLRLVVLIAAAVALVIWRISR